MKATKQSSAFSLLAAGLLFLLLLGSCKLEDTSFDTLVWSDEFNGTSIDTSNWIYDIGTGSGGWGNKEWQHYTSRRENARIEDFPGGGRGLVIEAREESYSGSGYTSARMKTQGLRSWTYGRIEARIKLPEGQGIWPAFWMLGDNFPTVGWPACGEIDIMELVGREPGTIHGTLHWGGSNQHSYDGESYSLPPGEKYSDDFHVFALEWEEGEIRWYMDGKLYSLQQGWYSTIGSWPAPFNRPFFLIMNIAVGGEWPGYPDGTTVFPQKMYVDYVRVYQ